MTAKRLLGPVSKTLLDAAGLIEQRGWWNGEGDPRLAVCADMAIGYAATGDVNLNVERGSYGFELYEAACERLKAHVGIAHLEHVGIPDWNDAHDAPRVIAALREAALA